MQIKLLMLITLLFAGGSAVLAGEDPIYTSFLNSKAVGGYDTVAYFTEGKAVKGKKDFQLEYMGADWRFVSKENLELFKAMPEKYAPQYGGYCAWAAARGYTASGDPKVWKVVKGKLYLNYNEDVKAKWEKDISGFIEAADHIFPTLVGPSE